MSESVRDRIASLLSSDGIQFDEYHHQPCGSSEESVRTRRSAGAGDTVGAKALLVREKKSGIYVLCVIPGYARLGSKQLKQIIGKNSFATSAEMEMVTGGLKPGHMPPFGPQLFDGIQKLIIDPELRAHKRLGFNAGDPTISIVLSGEDYSRVCEKNCVVFSLSE